MVNEIWENIKGYDKYQISNFGNVKRKKSVVLYSNNKVAIYKERPLKKEISRGYHRVSFSEKNIVNRFLVHRLVAQHFIKNENKKKCVNHLDGNKFNNHYSNLEWCTHSENEKHSYDVLGKINPIRKLKENAVIDIRKNAIKGQNGNINHFIEKYNVCRKTILNVVNRKLYV